MFLIKTFIITKWICSQTHFLTSNGMSHFFAVPSCRVAVATSRKGVVTFSKDQLFRIFPSNLLLSLVNPITVLGILLSLNYAI